MKRSRFVALSLGVCALLTIHLPAEDTDRQERTFVLDLKAGRILGAEMGMNEAKVRKALTANQFTDISRVNYATYFLLQCRGVPGLVFNFRGKEELNDIYTNSSEVVLSNGLKVGQSTQEFLNKLGEPKSSKRLPSGIGVELIFAAGDFTLGAIVLDEAPYVVRAMTLRWGVPADPNLIKPPPAPDPSAGQATKPMP